MKEPRCALCGLGVFSGAVLTVVTDRHAARSLVCRAWCGDTPAPAMSAARLDQIRVMAGLGSALERELLAEVDLLRRLVHRAEMDKHEVAGRVPEWVRETTHVAIELSGGRVLTASGLDWQEWWDCGIVAEAIEAQVDEASHILAVEVFDLSVPYVDIRGYHWAHHGDWQYDEPLMRQVDERDRLTAQFGQADWEPLGDLRSHHGPLTPVPRPAPTAEASA
jgi:hypothetical protein